MKTFKLVCRWVQNKDAVIVVFCNTPHSLNIAVQVWPLSFLSAQTPHPASGDTLLEPTIPSCPLFSLALPRMPSLQQRTRSTSRLLPPPSRRGWAGRVGPPVLPRVWDSPGSRFVPSVSDDDVTPPFFEAVRIARCSCHFLYPVKRNLCLCGVVHRSMTQRIRAAPPPDQLMRAVALTTAQFPSAECVALFDLPPSATPTAGYSCCLLDGASANSRSLRGQLLVTLESLIFETLIPSQTVPCPCFHSSG